MKIKLLNGNHLKLNSSYDSKQRRELVDELFKKHPSDFISKENNPNLSVKLDILATYLIQGDRNYNKDVLTQYKLKTRPIQEMSLSQITTKNEKEYGLVCYLA